MNWGKLLAKVLISLDVLASIGYFFAGDHRRAIYWISASVLTASVTF